MDDWAASKEIETPRITANTGAKLLQSSKEKA